MENRIIKETIQCSGALLYAKRTKRLLLLQKSSGKHEGTWGLVGGKNENGETSWQGLQREISEELGYLPEILKTVPLETFVSKDSLFNFHTYFCIVEEEFIPTLSHEHNAWGWFDITVLPKPVHKGLGLSLRDKTIQTKIQTIVDIIDYF